MYLMFRSLSIDSIIFLQYHKVPLIYLYENILSPFSYKDFSLASCWLLNYYPIEAKLLEALSLLSVTHSQSLIQTFQFYYFYLAVF